MKANELMIGDLVMFPAGPDKIIDLTYIAGRGICASFAASATLIPVPVEQLAPIPLTPEILEKNGFEKCNEDERDGAIQMEYGDKDLGVDIWIKTTPCLFGAWRRWEGEEKVYDMVSELPINHIHELQHALRLCGIEKEIVL